MLNNIIDVSHYQSITSYKELKDAGIIAMIHKATQGFSYVDYKYNARKQMWKNEMEMLFGSYHFQRAGDIPRQVKFFLDTVGNYENEILILDYEDGGQGLMSIKEAESFLNQVKIASNRPVVFYASDVILKNLNSDFIRNECLIWVARYSSKAPKTQDWDMWQYTENGKIKGIAGTIDRNKFRSDDIIELYDMWKAPYQA